MIVRTRLEARRHIDAMRAAGSSIGFVPTMGALHAGHRRLMERSVAECDFTVVSIFVNPLQFAPTDDLSRYPRPFDADVELALEVGAAMVFAPTIEEMYPRPMVTSVRVTGVADRWEGEHRPDHFEGVATVVAKLFGVIGPCRAYFGEKDFQQLTVITAMVSDLSMPIEVLGCPTVREADGLALSSRNVYLNGSDRSRATSLSAALSAGVDLIRAGERRRATIETAVRAVLDVDSVDYVAVVDAVTLEPLATVSGDVRLLVAARLGSTRLIDNMGVFIP